MFTTEVDKKIEQLTRFFYQSGVWQSDEVSEYRIIGAKLFFTFFGVSFPIFLGTNSVLCTDRNESFFSAELSILVSILFVKLLYLLYKKPEILTFLYGQTVVHSIQTQEEYRRVNKKIKKFMSFVRLYCLTIFITAPLIIACKLPIFSSDRSLPLFISFSWNDSEIIFWSVYLFVSLSSILYVIANFITLIIWYIMLNYSIELELLGNKFRRFGVGKKAKVVKKKKNVTSTQRKMFVEDLIVLIKDHRNLTETIEQFRSCFSKLFLGQITTSGIIICASVYNLAFASSQHIVQIELYIVMLMYGIIDIFLVMYLANDITLASDRLSYCLFESNWIEQTESCKKCVLIVGEVLKQPQQLVILIYPMNLETFMTIINGAYTMFNILKSFQ